RLGGHDSLVPLTHRDGMPRVRQHHASSVNGHVVAPDGQAVRRARKRAAPHRESSCQVVVTPRFPPVAGCVTPRGADVLPALPSSLLWSTSPPVESYPPRTNSVGFFLLPKTAPAWLRRASLSDPTVDHELPRVSYWSTSTTAFGH